MPKCLYCHTMNPAEALSCKKCKKVMPVSNGYTCPKCQTVNGPFRDTCKSCNFDIRSLKVTESRLKAKHKSKGDFFSTVMQTIKYITVLICLLILGYAAYFFVN